MSGGRRRRWLQAAALAAITLAAYGPALKAGFVVDDFALLLENPAIAARDGLARIWFSTTQTDYFPLTLTSFWLEWRLWKSDPLGYHVTNVVLHLVGVGLLWNVLARLRAVWAWGGAMLFAIHPVIAASVAWVSERKNTLAFVFFAATVILFLAASDDQRGTASRRRWYLGSVAAFLLGLLAKTSGVTLPIVLLGCSWWQRRRITRGDVVRTIPFFALSLLLGLVTVWFQINRAMSDSPGLGIGLGERVLRAVPTIGMYATKLLLPVGLSFAYAPWPGGTLPVRMLGPVVIAAVALAAVWRIPGCPRRALLFGVGSYVVLLAPVLGFVDMALLRYTPFADHWQHLAAPALLALVAAGAGTLLASMTLSYRARLVSGRLLGGALVAFLGIQTWRRVEQYRDDETLWRDAVAAAPSSAYAQASLGTVLFEQGRREQSRSFYLEAIRLEPAHRLAPLALYRLAVLDLDERRPDLALPRLERALALEPRYVSAHQLIAALLLDANLAGDAAPHVAALLSHSGLAAIAFGQSLARLGNPAQARSILASFIGRPLEARARIALGYADVDAGDLTTAERELAEAVRLDPTLTEGYLALVFIAERRADPERTAALLRKILELQPDNAEAIQKLQALGPPRRQN